MLATVNKEQVRLADGNYSPSQASDMLNALIDQKINYYKVLRWSMRVGNEGTDTSWLDEKIASLETDKNNLVHIIKEARQDGRQLEIKGELEISIV